MPGTIQAEDFDSGGEGLSYHDTTSGNRGSVYRNTDVDLEPSTDSGGGYNVGWVAPGEWLAYRVSVARPGSYTLEARVASRGAGGTFHVDVGDVNVTGSLAIPDTGDWQNWVTLRKTLRLAAGGQRMRIVFDTSGAGGTVGNLNFVRFISPAQPYGGSPRSLPGTIQAEQFDSGGEGVSYHDTTAGNRGSAYRHTNVDLESTTDGGGGYDVGWTAAGEWLTSSVDVQQSGSYTLRARVASRGPGGTFHIEVNGRNLSGPVSVPDTGGWQNWVSLEKSVSLSAGPQVMRVVFDAPGAGDDVTNLN